MHTFPWTAEYHKVCVFACCVSVCYIKERTDESVRDFVLHPHHQISLYTKANVSFLRIFRCIHCYLGHCL